MKLALLSTTKVVKTTFLCVNKWSDGLTLPPPFFLWPSRCIRLLTHSQCLGLPKYAHPKTPSADSTLNGAKGALFGDGDGLISIFGAAPGLETGPQAARLKLSGAPRGRMPKSGIIGAHLDDDPS